MKYLGWLFATIIVFIACALIYVAVAWFAFSQVTGA